MSSHSQSSRTVRVAAWPEPGGEPRLVIEGRPAPGQEPGDLPDAADVDRWLSVAIARLEQCLAAYDADLVDAADPCLSAERGVRRYMAWCRRSVVALVTVSGALTVTEDQRTRERIRWDQLAREAASKADLDPNGVERFLRLWLAVVHDAAATGYASVHGDPTAW